jgi:hypothetical protein
VYVTCIPSCSGPLPRRGQVAHGWQVRRFDEDKQQVISQLAELKGCKMELADLHQHAETLREQVRAGCHTRAGRWHE